MTQHRHIRIEYRVREDVDLELLVAAIQKFVAGMAAHDASHDYTSYRDAKDPRHFVHVGHFDESLVADLQTQPFFGEFTAALRGWAVGGNGAEVTRLLPVASTKGAGLR